MSSAGSDQNAKSAMCSGIDGLVIHGSVAIAAWLFNFSLLFLTAAISCHMSGNTAKPV